MSSHPDDKTFEYEGFSNPNGTIVPDDVFDVLMPKLADAELRVLLYIIRRTFGFKKNNDDISLRQMVEGITTRDGRVLDRGTGLSKPTVARGLTGLRTKKIIVATHNRSAERGNEATTYRLRFRGDDDHASEMMPDPRENQGRLPLSHQRDKGVSHPRDKGLSHQRDTQTTVLQQTDIHHSNIRMSTSSNNHFVDNSVSQSVSLESQNGHVADASPHVFRGMEGIGEVIKRKRGRPRKYSDEASQTILNYVADFSREFADRATVNQSAARFINDFHKWGRGDMDAFINVLYQARSITKSQNGVRNRFAYFAEVVEDLLNLKEDGARQTSPV